MRDEHGKEVSWQDFYKTIISVLPKMSQIDAKIVLTETYEMRYGIYNHTSPEGKKKPLASVAFFPSENVIERGPLYDAMIEFTENEYKEIWGYTFSQFMALPQWRVRMIREVTQEVIAKRTAALTKAKNNLGVD